MLMVVGGCQSTRAGASEQGDDPNGPRRYLALGDSYTIGTSIARADNFPNQLADRLRQTGSAVADPVIIAEDGWTTSDLAGGIDRRAPERPFDLVTLLIGVNNQFQGGLADAFRPDFVQLLDTATALAGGHADHVLVVSIPDYGVTPFGQQRDPEQIADDLGRFNAVCRRQATKAGAQYVEVTEVSRRAADNRALVADDGLHPAAQMYGLWVDRLAPVARQIIGEQ